jgi:IclR family acetate operon transcriptional repressor
MSNQQAATTRSYNAQSLDRGLLAVALLRDSPRGELGLSELARGLGLHKSTVHRLLTTLVRHDYVAQDPITKRYRLGLAFLGFAHAAVERLEVRRHALRAMHTLAEESGESVYLNVLSGGLSLCIDGVVGPRGVTVDTNAGVALPLHATATGKCFLAWLPSATRAAYLSRVMEQVTPHTITSPSALLLHLEEARRRGYAVNDEETEPGVRYAAAPIFDHEGSIVASLSLGAPVMRIGPAELTRLGAAVAIAAAHVSASLGYARPTPVPATHGTGPGAPRPLVAGHVAAPRGGAGGPGETVEDIG